jgi:hypothetical protein
MTNSELKSKVMTLGNKLAPRMGGDRKAAFVEAWVIVKKGGLELAVRGVSFGNRQEAWPGMPRNRSGRYWCRSPPIRQTPRLWRS